MKRFAGLLTGLVVLGSLVAAGPASADFHLQSQACAIAVGNAAVGISEATGAFTFTGSVMCDGATSVSIDSLAFAPVPTNGYAPFGRQVIPPPTTAYADTSNSKCTSCGTAPVTATGTTPSAPGLYAVTMNFTAIGPGGTFKPQRKMGIAWSGAIKSMTGRRKPSCLRAASSALTMRSSVACA